MRTATDIAADIHWLEWWSAPRETPGYTQRERGRLWSEARAAGVESTVRAILARAR